MRIVHLSARRDGPSDGDDLVWRPTDAQSRLLALINGATTALSLYPPDMLRPAV